LFLLKFGKSKIDDKVMDELNKWGAKVYDDAYSHYLKMAEEENENVAKIFDDWWHGKCVSTEKYKNNYSDSDHRRASDIILTAISNGFG
jgi:hypothetical protein